MMYNRLLDNALHTTRRDSTAQIERSLNFLNRFDYADDSIMQKVRAKQNELEHELQRRYNSEQRKN